MLLALLGAGLCGPSFAASEHVTGRVTRIYAHGTSIKFQLDAGCKVGTNMYWSFSLSGDMTKAWYAMLLSAANNRAPVTFAYPGPCSSVENQEIWYVVQNF